MRKKGELNINNLVLKISFPLSWLCYLTPLTNIIIKIITGTGFPGDTVVNNLPANAGDARDKDLIPGSGRYPEAENENLLQYSCLENPMDRGA